MNDNLLTQMIYRIVTCCVSALAVLLTFRFFHNFYGSSALWEFALSLDTSIGEIGRASCRERV